MYVFIINENRNDYLRDFSQTFWESPAQMKSDSDRFFFLMYSSIFRFCFYTLYLFDFNIAF